jgi:hypothetical protein
MDHVTLQFEYRACAGKGLIVPTEEHSHTENSYPAQ